MGAKENADKWKAERVRFVHSYENRLANLSRLNDGIT
jgi:hypothetical protein